MICSNRWARASALALLLLPAGPLQAQTPVGDPLDAAPGAEVRYDVSFPNAVHHEAHVLATFDELPAGEPLEVLMSRASPGRYALHEFAKNVYRVSARDGAGRPLDVRRVTPHEWHVHGHDGTVRLEYTLFANHADGTYAGIDSTHAHFNMPAAFMFARGLEQRPIRIAFRPINDWRVATQLRPTDEPHTFVAPDLQYFMDSPTELSDHTLLEWRMGPADEAHFRMALHHAGTRAEGEAYVEKARRVLAEQAAVFGEFPDFDHGSYTFLADYLPWVFRDGMEHRNSTILTSPRSLAEAEASLLGTLAHESFHAWNMERLRDAALVPFDFTRANMSENLWFGEGFTSYYDGLSRVRAGVLPLEDYVGDLTGVLNYVLGSPARAFRGPADMSRMAPFVDAARSVDETNYANTFVSYYSWGEALGLGLDLLLRQRFGRTLDDYMRALWTQYGRHQADQRPTRPYTAADLERVLGEVTGDPAFAAEFFDRHIETGEALDYAALVEPAGLVLRRARPDQGSLGSLSLRAHPGGALITAAVPPGSAAAEAGVASGDRLISIDGHPTPSADAVADILDAMTPGQPVTLVYEQTGMRKTGTVELQPSDELELVTFEQAGRALTPAMRSFRNGWLGSKAE